MSQIHYFAVWSLLTLIVGPELALSQDSSQSKVPESHPSTRDWPVWRGPLGNGIADPNQSPPTQWDGTSGKNIRWEAPIPGRGHSSPIVVQDFVLITTAEEANETQSVLAFDRQTGKLRWQADVHRGGLDTKGNKKTSQASSTMAWDGQRLIVNFLNQGAVYTTALDLTGKQIWQTKVSDFATHQGFGSSPAIDRGLAYITTDSRGGGVVAALDCATGKLVWQVSRPKKANYASAAVLHAAGRKQILVQGCDLVSSFDPLTGKTLWEIEGATTECVTTVVTDGERVFASGGYPRKHVQAVIADGSGKTAWENTIQIYVPSMIVHQGHLFAIQDAGIAMCWKSDTGEEMWKERVGGTFSASLVLVKDNLYAVNESGECFIFKANPQKFEEVARNKLGDEVFATPAICGGEIFLRAVDSSSGARQEMLYCVANPG